MIYSSYGEFMDDSTFISIDGHSVVLTQKRVGLRTHQKGYFTFLVENGNCVLLYGLYSCYNLLEQK